MKYKILKDTPTIKAGTLGEIVDNNYAFKTFDSSCGDLYEHFKQHFVESTPEWFEPVIERWRADKWCIYFSVHFNDGYMKSTDSGSEIDDDRFQAGNYFRTKEQAEEAAKRVKEVLMKFHEELGE